MIEVKELRVGNKVYSNQIHARGVDLINPYPFTVSAISTTGLMGVFLQFEETGQAAIAIEGISGIPLTPEILENAGFERNDNFRTGAWTLDDIDLVEADGRFELFGSEWSIGKPFDYLHELQNICFSLFRMELPIKLTTNYND